MVEAFSTGMTNISTELSALLAVILVAGIGVFAMKWVPKQGFSFFKGIAK